ncbi:MAG: S8/S53 family peptidase, partial [Sphingomonas sp.]
AIAPFVTCGAAPVGTSADVATLLNTQELWNRGLNGANVAIGIVDSGINLPHLTNVLGFTPSLDAANSWTPTGAGFAAGNYPVDHGTMCAFDVLIAAPGATLIDVPVLSNPSAAGGSVMAGFLSAAVLAYTTLYASWNSGIGSGDLSQYSALVLSNSWGIFHPSWDFPAGHPGRYCDNPNHPFNILLETMSRGGIDVLFAAGNCGADCPDTRCQNRSIEAIMGASASVDALSIAGCDINNERVGYSSQGPSIAGMYQMKPDFTSYTHFLGSQAFGANVPDSGTSAACPVAAGCMAALRTKISPRTPATPYMMYDHFRGQASTPTGLAAGWNADYGAGIINTVPIADLFGV